MQPVLRDHRVLLAQLVLPELQVKLVQPVLREKLVLWDHRVKLVQQVLPDLLVLSLKPVLPVLLVLSVKLVLPDLLVQRDLKGKRESQVLPQ